MRRQSVIALILAASCAAPVTVVPAPGVRVVERVGARSLRRSIDSVINAAEFANGHWGVLVVDTKGDTLYSHNAGKLFMPASNQKILTSAVALTQLGPDYRHRTSFVAHGAIEGGILNGDLGVVGRGDPSVSDHMRDNNAMQPLLEIADSLAARGIRRIRGKVVAEGDAFADEVLGFGWSWSDLEEAYSAATDELLFNEGFTNVIVAAGAAAGDSVRVETSPTKTWPRLRVSAVTVAPVVIPADTTQPRPPRPAITIRKDTLSGDVLVGGTIAAGRVDTLVVTHRDPDAAYLAAFREALLLKGITIGDEAVPPAASDTLLTFLSPPLREILPPFMKPSQNQIGEMLFKTLGLERDSTRVGTAMAGRRVVEKQLIDWGATPAGFIVRDGSGLSRYDYVSPETIVHVLAAMRRDTAFAAYYDAMPIAGVDGTIRGRMRGTPAAGNVRAKTGSVAQARSLSGYVQTLTGDTLIFSILANNWNVPAGRVTSAADSIAARLASYRRR
jgi:serine-type D-Ala-D-Ala carboxypeptidase/endopeptidase (penicillin-binding protein 4)